MTHVTLETSAYTRLCEEQQIERTFDVLGAEIHHIAADKQFYSEPKTVDELIDDVVPSASDPPDWIINRDELVAALRELITKARETMPRSEAELVALEHSELSEALEGIRAGNPPDDKLKEFSSAEVELADAVIRICDHANFKGYRLGAAIRAKIAYNRQRAIKHGKKF